MLPLVLGGLCALLGLALLFDAWVPDNVIVPQERRKKPRRERDKMGEAFVGLGAIAMAATFIGRDTWRYSVLSAIVGSVLLLLGAWRSVGYIRELFTPHNRAKPVVEGSRKLTDTR
jgi:hypothetical protein